MTTLIRAIFSDLAWLYKNFFHWNISKFVLSLYGLLFGILLWVAPLLLAGVFLYFSDLDYSTFMSFLLWWGDTTLFMWALFSSPFSSILSIIMIVLTGVCVYFGVWYGSFLISALSLKYIDRKLPKYFNKKRYLNIKRAKKFAVIVWWLLLLSGGLFLIYSLLMILSIVLFGWMSGVNELLLNSSMNAFSISTLIITIIFGAIFLYYAYRFSFAHLSYLDKNDHSITWLDYIKKSYTLTAGWKNFLRFIGVFIWAMFLLLPINVVDDHISTTARDLTAYADFLSAKAELWEQEFESQLSSDEDLYEYYTLLSTSYAPMSLDQAVSSIQSYQTYRWIFNIFYFICIYGVLHMVLSSFYIHGLKKKK